MVIREVLERDPDGNATVVVYRFSPEDEAREAQMRSEQAERARDVARSLRPSSAA